jgi:hypothetical protein
MGLVIPQSGAQGPRPSGCRRALQSAIARRDQSQSTERPHGFARPLSRQLLVFALLALCAASTLVAQFPVPRVPTARHIPVPNIDRWVRGEPPLSTSLKDARIEVPWLDTLRPRFSDLASLKNGGGTFTLRPGHWSMDLQSFCVHPGTRGPQPTDGRGYLSAPMRGPRAEIVTRMLEGFGRMPDVGHHDMQTLLWAILSRTRIRSMSTAQQSLAARLLTPAQLAAIETGAVDVIPVSLRRQAFAALPPEARRLAEAENRLRETLLRPTHTYASLERAAVLTGPLPSTARTIPRERWSIHPGGYLIRYLPLGFARTTVEIAVPAKYQIRRDRLGRIVSVDFGDGRRTETEYDDSIPPFQPPGVTTAVGYAFKSVRLVRTGASGVPEEVVVRGKGWTFVVASGRSTTRQPMPTFGFRLASMQAPSWMERFETWKGRYDTWNEEFRGRAEWYRDRAKRATDPPPDVAQTVRDIEDLEHYRDGIDAALRGDIGGRLDWLIDHQERMNAALERATIVLSGLPDRPEDEYSPARDVAIPAGGQRLGLSSRGF